MRDSLDLLLDADGDAAVRSVGAALGDAGLGDPYARSRGHHAPHVTIAERDEVGPERDEALGALPARLPVDLVLGPPVVLGGPDRRTLALVVAATPALLALHAEAAAVLGPGGPAHGDVGRWLPHVTVSTRLRDEQVAPALSVLDACGPPSVVVGARLRRWLPALGEVRGV